MRSAILLVVVAVVVGCGPIPGISELDAGPDIDSGTTVDAGIPDAGHPDPVLTWVDATGAVVSPGDVPTYTDATGRAWDLDPATANLDASKYVTLSRVYYAGVNCLGTDFIESRPVGVPFRILGDDSYRVRLATSTAQSLDYTHVIDFTVTPASCQPNPGTLTEVVPYSQVSPANIVAPTFSYAAPLHQEMR